MGKVTRTLRSFKPRHEKGLKAIKILARFKKQKTNKNLWKSRPVVVCSPPHGS